MNFKRKVMTWAMAAGIGFGGLVATVPSYADFGHHGHDHHHFHPHHFHHHHRHDGGAIAAGVLGAAVIGGIIATAASHNDDTSCKQVYYTRNCDYDSDGDQTCYNVKHVRYGC
jgi:hypothetical protein